MSLLLRQNPDAPRNSAIILTQNVVREKGVAQPALRNYTLTVDVTGLNTQVVSIQIGGQSYTFASAAVIADGDFLTQLRTGIEAAFEAHSQFLAGGDTTKAPLVFTGDLHITQSGNDLTVSQYKSHVVLDSLTDNTGTPVVTAFTASDSLRG